MKKINIILTKDVALFGKAGDVKSVPLGYFRNFLLRRGVASVLTPSTQEKLAETQSRIRAKAEKEKSVALKLKESIEATPLTFTLKTGARHAFGSVTSHAIQSALKEKGIAISKGAITLEKSLKEIGTFSVPIDLHHGVVATAQVTIEAENK